MKKSLPLRRSFAAVLILTAVPAAALLAASPGHAATYTWQNAASDFTLGSNWSPSGPPAADADLAQFTTFGTSSSAAVNPVLDAAVNTGVWFGQTFSGTGYTLSGTGSLTVGSGRTRSGLVTRGIANTTIDLGSGTAASLSILGLALNTKDIVSVGYGSTLTLAGTTTAEKLDIPGVGQCHLFSQGGQGLIDLLLSREGVHSAARTWSGAKEPPEVPTCPSCLSRATRLLILGKVSGS
jgi:hypothetical protein